MKRSLLLLLACCLIIVACLRKGDKPMVATYAGNGNMGTTNGDRGKASFNNLMGLAVDSNGNVFVADTRNNLIRKISSDGTVSTIAGSGVSGNADGPAAKASFNYPIGLTVDPNGNIYVADTQNNSIRKISIDGSVSTVAGMLTPANRDHPEDTTRLDNPHALVSDKQGNIYFTDYTKDVIRKISPSGKVSTVAGNFDRGAKDGKGMEASFYLPAGIAIDGQGTLYVADCYNNMIRKISPDGTVSTLAGKPAPRGKKNNGAKDGKGPLATFNHPFGIAVDKHGVVYVADVGNQMIRKITPDGLVSTLAGSRKRGSDNGIASKATFFNPYGLAIDKAGNLYIADCQNSMVRKLTF